MTRETMTALMLAPGMQPVATELYKDRNFIQKAVSIEAESLCSVGEIPLGRVTVLYGEEAAIYGAPGNRRVGARILSGVFYIVGSADGALGSLTEEDIRFYRHLFWGPEKYDCIEAIEDAVLSWLCAKFFSKKFSRQQQFISGHKKP